MNDLVGYESLLERDCLMVADHDCNVVGIASHPLWLQVVLDGQPVRHLPDYLLARRDGAWTLVSALITTLWSGNVSVELDLPLANDSLVTDVRRAA